MGEGISAKDKEDLGSELKQNNEKIVECILLLREHRSELIYLIKKQQEERAKLETEVERITYKICLINRSITQREKIKTNYDTTLDELEKKYAKLVKDSGDLLCTIQKEFQNLDNMNKSTSTSDAPTQGWEPASGESTVDISDFKQDCICIKSGGQETCPPVKSIPSRSNSAVSNRRSSSKNA